MHIAITGASSGIGEALAQQFGTEGNTLTLVARRLPLLQKLAESLPCPVHISQVDLGQTDQCADWVDAAEAAHGPIDVLINNAGVQYVEPTLGVAPERIDLLFAINVLAPMRLIHRVAPGMVERGQGHIVNISSMAAITHTPGMCHYNASKAALAAASESLAVELKASGVHVCTVYPGPVTTPMETAAREGYGNASIVEKVPTGNTRDLANLVATGIKKRHVRLVYPKVYGLARYFRISSQWVTDTFTPPLPDDDEAEGS